MAGGDHLDPHSRQTATVAADTFTHDRLRTDAATELGGTTQGNVVAAISHTSRKCVAGQWRQTGRDEGRREMTDNEHRRQTGREEGRREMTDNEHRRQTGRKERREMTDNEHRRQSGREERKQMTDNEHRRLTRREGGGVTMTDNEHRLEIWRGGGGGEIMDNEQRRQTGREGGGGELRDNEHRRQTRRGEGGGRETSYHEHHPPTLVCDGSAKCKHHGVRLEHSVRDRVASRGPLDCEGPDDYSTTRGGVDSLPVHPSPGHQHHQHQQPATTHQHSKATVQGGPRWPLLALVLVMLLPSTLGLPAVIRIGAILTEDQRDSATELAFKYAVYKINSDKIILPNTTLVFDIQYVPRDDSFHTAKKACRQITFGVQAMFGPFDPLLGSHIQSITDALDIPHLEARLDIEPQEKEFSINLFPSHNYLNQAYKDMIRFLKWKKVAIIYEEDFGLMKLQEIIRSPPSKAIEMYIRQGHPDNYRDILKEVKHKEIFSIIVDTLPRNMRLFLRCLLQLQMNDYRYHYLFTTFDIETFDLEDFKYNYVNMTAFRIVDTNSLHVRKILKDMERFQPIGHSILNKTSIIKAEPALIYDSVNVFAKGLHALERSANLSLANLSCESETPWADGSSLLNYINAVEYEGLTGPIKFTEGKRTNFKLDILKLRLEELYKVGEWSTDTQINITDSQAFFEGGRPNITLKIITIEESPYVMQRRLKNIKGNARYFGFCIDLLDHLTGMVGFNYDIELETKGRYGSYNQTTGDWDGLVRIVMDKKADLAVGSMTINYARESVIDFTKPFMNLGISILFKIPTSQPTRLFSFMNPLAVEIWLYVLAAYVLVSFTMFVMARFSPYEWNNPHPCNAESDVVENQFSVSNSFWFITGTLLRQGSGLNPKAASTRIVGGIWWFFTLIIISSYTANLAAFLTVERMITPIESAEDLAEQSEIEYGTLEGGSTMAFFRDSKIETYQKMWRYMESKRPSVFVPTIEEGVKRVLEGNYAFLMESTMLDYTIQRNCNLTQIGGLLNSNSYGIATPIGSPWRDKISLAILELQEKGIIQMLYSKWWKNTGDVCNRDEKNKDSKANALGVENIGGVFVVLMCGLALAIVVAILEFCWNSKKNAQTDRDWDNKYDDHEDKNDKLDEVETEVDENGELRRRPSRAKQKPQSLCSEMAEELRFAMKCHGSRQRPALKRNCSRCAPGTTYVPAATDLSQANGENGLLPMIEMRKSSVVQFDATSPP